MTARDGATSYADNITVALSVVTPFVRSQVQPVIVNAARLVLLLVLSLLPVMLRCCHRHWRRVMNSLRSRLPAVVGTRAFWRDQRNALDTIRHLFE